MAWNNNRDLLLFHGTNSHALNSAGIPVTSLMISTIIKFQVNVGHSQREADFSQGFYTTTSLHQAREWANESVRKLANAPVSVYAKACVLSFAVKRDDVAPLDSLTFVIASDDYFDFVEHCRRRPGQLSHAPTSRQNGKHYYDVVFGPVSLGWQRLVIHDCDQISFHDQTVANTLLVSPVLREYAGTTSGQLP